MTGQNGECRIVCFSGSRILADAPPHHRAFSQKSTPPTFAHHAHEPIGVDLADSLYAWSVAFPRFAMAHLAALPPAMLNDGGAGCRGWQHDFRSLLY